MAPGWEALLHRHALDSVERLCAGNRGTVVTCSGSTEVRRIELPEPDGARTLFIKKYWFDTFSRRLKGSLRGTFLRCSKVQREYENLGRLRSWNLDAPQPVAWGTERRLGWLHRSVLVSEGVPEAIGLDAWFVTRLPGLPASARSAQLRQLLPRLARDVARMHEHRFVHGDLYWRNILLSGESLEHFHLIDAHHGRIWNRWQERRCRASDLAALDAVAPGFVSKTRRLRFLLDYLSQPRLTAEGRALAREILRQAAPIREAQQRRLPRKPASPQPVNTPLPPS